MTATDLAGYFARRQSSRPINTVFRSPVPIARWSISVTPPGGTPVDVTIVRGVPTQLGSFSFTDPFGPDTLQFALPAVTIFDQLGADDLAWLVRDANVDLNWVGPTPAGLQPLNWPGLITSFDWAKDGLQISCVGAMHQLDNYLSKPEYPARPLPYEYAISHQFDPSAKPNLRLKPLKLEWPHWWKTTYSDPAKGTPSYQIPVGVKSGDNWTAMLTRTTGSWDQALTGYVQSLLSSMYTERGRFTLDLDPGRQPVLRHRDMRFVPAPDIPVIDPVWPTIDIQLSEDWSQSLNVAYGQGTSLSGVVYTGMEVTPDGQTTYYDPLAAARQVDPVTDKNGWFQRSRVRREVMLELQAGLGEDQAKAVAVAHLARFGDPGVTGQITLGADPLLNGVPISRYLIRAGMTVQVPKLFGSPDGLLLHVTQSTVDFSSDAVTLTVDSKYRDQLTVSEVQLRGRDALAVTRMLVAGGYQPPVSDQLLPWNYATGSGCIPGDKQGSSWRLWQDMPNSVKFPWTDWTTQRPPKSAAWKDCYIHLPPANVNADKNWSSRAGSVYGIPIFVGQAGSIRLLQLAAYDANGNVLPIPFHFSLYKGSGVNYQSMPRLIAPYGNTVAYRAPGATVYFQNGQHYPFHPNAWEQYKQDGTVTNPETQNAADTAGLIKAWGSGYEKAGFWPGSSGAGNSPTGLLVDELSWNFDTTNFDAQFDPLSTVQTAVWAGYIFCMIYADGQANQDVYFAGRIFRVEPGTQ